MQALTAGWVEELVQEINATSVSPTSNPQSKGHLLLDSEGRGWGVGGQCSGVAGSEAGCPAVREAKLLYFQTFLA